MRRFSSNSNRFNNGNRFGQSRFRGRRAPAAKKLNPALFVKKATVLEKSTDHVTTVSFDNLKIDVQLKNNIIKKGYTTQTAIQEKSIGHILEGKDVVGVANTGTGKTAAFLIPLLDKVVKNKQEKVIIVVPTRELAMQIRDEIREFAQSMGIYATLCIGGSYIRHQIDELRRNPNFVIGTPGRIKDLIERRVLNISTFGTIVLDEVDRMLDMGFIHEIRHLISLLPQKRQSLFFSATLSPEIKSLINSFAPHHVLVSVGTDQGTEHIDQDVVRVNGTPKIQMLQDLLNKEEFKKVLVFVRTKRGAERLSRDLYDRGFKVNSIHGDKSQNKRSEAIRHFEMDIIRVLVATDVASRGIDIGDITHVINYDQPATREDYVHRIGRTGRAEKKGIALTFID